MIEIDSWWKGILCAVLYLIGLGVLLISSGYLFAIGMQLAGF